MQRFNLDKVTYKILKKERSHIDRIMLAIGILNPLAAIPQVYAIYTSGSAENVSLFMWTTYVFTSLLTLAYGSAHKLRPLIISSILWLVVEVAIVVGCIIFR